MQCTYDNVFGLPFSYGAKRISFKAYSEFYQLQNGPSHVSFTRIFLQDPWGIQSFPSLNKNSLET